MGDEIIRSATLVDARRLGREDPIGAIKPVMIADLIVVDGPLNDVATLSERHISLVIQGGVLVKNMM